MNPDLLHLKITLWKSFNVFPSDKEIFEMSGDDRIFYVVVPSIFVWSDVLKMTNRYNYEVVKIVCEIPFKIKDVNLVFSNTNYDAFNLTFNALSKTGEMNYSKKNDFNIKENILKIIEWRSTEGYVPEESKWCWFYEFFDVFQNFMF